ncbi:MAG: 1-acyl-sn-glycerol-3-phosphate acyltransferase [Alphaproteobacteria bacterium]|nr:1-acyl-sn-glycerol-3-phosphate acyltransferase [Alphaproteobacteria bacterium]
MQYIGFRRWLLWRVLWLVYVPLAWVVFRQRNRGLPRPPPKGPYLLMGNHVSAMDPIWAAWALWHPAHFMASANLFRVPWLRRLITALGAFPKQKFVKDQGSVSTLVDLYEAGQIILIYPEGTRTWDGRGIPIRPGTGRLIKQLNARVVFCRNLTGWMLEPRWALYPRWVPLLLEYTAPMTFPEDMSAEDITAEVQRQLTIDPEPAFRGLCLGWRLAWGLPVYLWACPHCFAVEGLVVPPGRGNHVRCHACGAQWRVDIRSRLVSETEGVASWTVRAAYDRIAGHFGDPPLLDADTLEAEGLVLKASDASVVALDRRSKARTELARGELRLERGGLRVLDLNGEETWSMGWPEIKAFSVEVNDQLQVITADQLLRVEPGRHSTLLWSHFLRHWWWHSRPDLNALGPVPPP